MQEQPENEVPQDGLPTAAYAVVEGNPQKLPWRGCAHASRSYRQTIEKLGLGARDTPALTVYDSAGKQVGYLSYNGRVWAGAAQHWQEQVDKTPVYCPFEAERSGGQ